MKACGRVEDRSCCGRTFTGRSWGGHRRAHARAFVRDDADRFWSKVDRSGGPDACWPWTRATHQGYGWFRLRGVSITASRFAWRITHGPIPVGLYVCHTCDNRPCCNPAHLWLGTQADNVRDMFAKGRQGTGRARGEAVGGARLTETAVRSIRDLHGAGRSKRSLGFAFGVSRRTVQQVLSGDTWRHVA